MRRLRVPLAEVGVAVEIEERQGHDKRSIVTLSMATGASDAEVVSISPAPRAAHARADERIRTDARRCHHRISACLSLRNNAMSSTTLSSRAATRQRPRRCDPVWWSAIKRS